MHEIKTLSIDNVMVSAAEGTTVLDAAREHGIDIPTLCHLDGLEDVGACRLCLVEAEGQNKLLPACVTRVEEGMSVKTHSPRLLKYRRMILELLFSERNHVCSVCGADGHCELQTLARRAGMDHVRFDYLHPALTLDATHERFVLDHNRCILCTRCIRICDDVEGAHTLDTAGRACDTSLVTDMADTWSDARSCTSCGKCLLVCPTGALFEKGSLPSEHHGKEEYLKYIVNAQRKMPWKR
ncbi:MAG: bidirectional hydrogenase complex protein HoxU [Ignavibacteria bacterium]|nr:MAG: bidirectional hydrogenase complex protein HoxU [Ignavibacteria bacterium]